jgi:hypothetical protein
MDCLYMVIVNRTSRSREQETADQIAAAWFVDHLMFVYLALLQVVAGIQILS